MTPKSLAYLLVFLCTYFPSNSQDSVSIIDKITGFPDQFFKKVNKKTASLESRLDKQTQKYIQRLLRKERKLKTRLAKKDSVAAAELFADIENQYTTANSSPIRGANRITEYFPNVDTLKTSLSFLDQNSEVISGSKDILGKARVSSEKLSALQSKLQQSDQVRSFIARRRELIRQTLSRYTQLPKSITRQYSQFNKEVYYYAQQVKEYKELLNDPDRLTQKALSALTRLNVFQQFMREHSQLSGLFSMPSNATTMSSLTGVQTRGQVQQLIQTQLAAAGPNAQQVLQQNLQSAQQQLSDLKEKLIKTGSSATAESMPDFKPNNQRTKNFLQRLEVGTNLQSTKSNYFFPVTTDLGVSIGYKLNNNSIIGIGGSYKVGWGKSIREIVITSEGMGLRSFLEMKLKGSFFASGGFEYNYQGYEESSATTTGQGDLWTKSGLVGISKVISLKTKFFKKTKMQLLWDFLSYQQQPRTQALKFRIGYSF